MTEIKHADRTQKSGHYPITLTRLMGKRVVVFGGGPVGERKVRGLLDVMSTVIVISPEITSQLQTWVEQDRVIWEPRVYQAGDCSGAIMIFATTSSREANQKIAQEAERLNILCNVADAPEEGSFHLPAVHRGAESLISVSTYGINPKRARELRDKIAVWLGDLSNEDRPTKREVVLVGHGSRVPKSIDEFNTFADALSKHIEQPVRIGFLELSQPEMNVALTDAAKTVGEHGEVLVVPMFLGSAYHMKAEIFRAIQQVRDEFPKTAIRYSTPLGFHVKLAELLKIRVEAALAAKPDAKLANETTVLIVGGGSSDPDSNSNVSKAARVLYEMGDYAGVEVAYQFITRPTTAEGIERVYLLGAKQVVVVPFLLFTGIVHQKTVAAANEAASQLGMEVIHADCLGPKHPFLIDVAAQRYLEATDGTSELLQNKTIEGFSRSRSNAD